MKTKLASFMIILLILMTFAAIVQAAPAGKVTNLDGRADITAPGQPAKTLSIGDTVNVGDIIRTKRGSKCEILWVDGSIARLAENSRLQVNEFNMEKEMRSTIIVLFRGKVQNIVIAATKLFGQKEDSKYEVHTPTAVVGVRGTKFFAYHQDGTSGALFAEGNGYIYSKGRPDAVKSIASGQMMVVTNVNKPPVAREATAGELNKFMKDTTPAEKKKDTKKSEEDKGKAETSKSGDSGSISGGSTEGTMLGGDPTATTVSGTTIGGSTGADTITNSTGGSITSGTTTDTTPPYVPPIQETVITISTGTISSALFNKGDGKIEEEIQNTTQKTGETKVSGTTTELTNVWSGRYLSGDMSNGSKYTGYFTGIMSNWRGLTSSIYVTGSGAGYLYGELSGTYDQATGKFSGSGPLQTNGGIIGNTSMSPAELESSISTYSYPLPVIGNINVGGYIDPLSSAYTENISGISTVYDGRERQLAVWGVTTQDGTFQNTDSLGSWTNYYGRSGSENSYQMLGTVSGTDDLSGHVTLNGNLDYLDNDYMGKIEFDNRGFYSGSSYQSAGAGRFTLDKLAVRGEWWGDAYYYNNSGSATTAGNMFGLIGGLTAPWKTSADLLSIGQLSSNSALAEYPRYLWNNKVILYDTSYASWGNAIGSGTGGYAGIYAAGIWEKQDNNKGTATGAMRAFYMAPAINGQSEAGILSGDLSGYYYDINMWKNEGSLSPTVKSTINPAGLGFMEYSASGINLSGNFGGSGSISGQGDYINTSMFGYSDTNGYEGYATLPWGIYSLTMGGPSNSFSDKPTGDASWSALVGGSGVFAHGGNGYWKSTASGNWSETGIIHGNVNGEYMDRFHKGTLTGPFYGINSTAGTWIGQSIGSFEGTALTFVSDIYPAMWSYDGSWQEESNLTIQGLLGSTDSLWGSSASAPISISAMGKTERSGLLSSERHIFNYETYSSNYKNDTKTTYDGGSVFLYYGGRELNDQIEANIAGLYIKDGKAGLLRGNIGGNVYKDIGMWKAEGTMSKEEKATTSILAENLNDNLWRRDSEDSLTGSVSSSGGNLIGSIAYNRVVALYDSAGTQRMEGGIWQASFSGNKTLTALWTAKAGGQGVFGPTYNGISFVDDSGYWLVDVKNGMSSDYSLSANISGEYLTRTRLGTMDGNLSGTYNGTNWQDAAVGTYQKSKDLLFSSSLSGSIFQTVKGTLYISDYQKPSIHPYSGYFDPLNYETAYMSSGSDKVKYGWQMETLEFRNGRTQNREKINYDYRPNDTYQVFAVQNGVPAILYFGSTSKTAGLPGFGYVWPDLSTSPPTFKHVSGGYTLIETANIISDIYPFTGQLALDPAQNQYAKVFAQTIPDFYYTTSLNPDSAEPAFQGIMGAYRKDGDPDTLNLWSATASQTLGLSFLGKHISFTGPAPMSTGVGSSSDNNGITINKTPDGGAYYGFLSNHIADDRTSAGMFYGLYISPSGEAGFLQSTDIAGASYDGINMWKATGDIYSTKKLDSITVSADQLLQQDANGNWLYLQFGTIAGNPNSGGGIKGDFVSNGSMTQLGLGQGHTLSIKGYPDNGVFIRGDSGGTYNNPDGATKWRADFAGSAIFGYHDNVADYGIWQMSVADPNQSNWADNKISAPLTGEFLTWTKQGTMTGSLIGGYSGTTSGIWGATKSGIYEKTKDVAFSSGLEGKVFSLNKWIEGNNTNLNYNYYIGGDPTKFPTERMYAQKWSTTNGRTTNTQYSDWGYSDDTHPVAYKKTTWEYTQGWNSTNNSWYISDPKLIEASDIANADYSGEIAAMRQGVSETTGLRMDDNELQGIFAGFNNNADNKNLWDNIALQQYTSIALAGLYGTRDTDQTLMTATLASFNPAIALNPFYKSTSPIGGAYYGYLGAAFGMRNKAYDTLDGNIIALYLNPAGRLGILYGTFSGSNLPEIGAWKGSGNIKGFDAVAVTGDVTPANFVSKITTASAEYRFIAPDYLYSVNQGSGYAVNVPIPEMGGSTSSKYAYWTNESAYLLPSYYQGWTGGSFGIFKLIAGGTYDPNETPIYKFHKVDFYNQSNLNQTTYDAVDWDNPNTTPNTVASNVRNGSVLHNGVFDPAKATGRVAVSVSYSSGGTSIQGNDIKGLFDPNKATWQTVGNGTSVETAAFMNGVNSATGAQKEAFMAAMKIPCINVGQVDLTGSRGTAGDSLSVNMNGVTFYAYSTGQAPKLFATKNVGGSYDVSSLGGAMPAAVNLSASNATNLSGVSATFTPKVWNTTTNKWGAEVKGTGMMASPATGIKFLGGAAGSTSGGTSGTFSGTGAGIVRPQ